MLKIPSLIFFITLLVCGIGYFLFSYESKLPPLNKIVETVEQSQNFSLTNKESEATGKTIGDVTHNDSSDNKSNPYAKENIILNENKSLLGTNPIELIDDPIDGKVDLSDKIEGVVSTNSELQYVAPKSVGQAPSNSFKDDANSQNVNEQDLSLQQENNLTMARPTGENLNQVENTVTEPFSAIGRPYIPPEERAPGNIGGPPPRNMMLNSPKDKY